MAYFSKVKRKQYRNEDVSDVYVLTLMSSGGILSLCANEMEKFIGVPYDTIVNMVEEMYESTSLTLVAHMGIKGQADLAACSLYESDIDKLIQRLEPFSLAMKMQEK